MTSNRCPLLSHSISLAVAMALAAPVLAQETGEVLAEGTLGMEEITVTARKREETAIEVPVALSAFDEATLERRAITTMDGLARAVPQLIIGEGGGTVQGGSISLRGISGVDANPLGDQAVSFNVDGVQVARATVRRMSEMDLEQITVLKGPQALFYGKNSPGGIVVVRTGDPTDEFDAKVSTGYEVYAGEWRTEGFVAGPVTDTLGYRLAGFYSTMDGWTDSTVPASSTLQPRDEHAPDETDQAVRVTLKWEPTDSFDARFKVTYNDRSGASSAANVQFVDCPTGSPQQGTLDDCKADDKVSVADPGSGFDGIPNGHTYLEQEQWMSGLEMNYDLTESLIVTSVTSYYAVDLDNFANFTSSYNPVTVLPSRNLMKIDELAEELRLTSNFDGRFNFMTAAYYQDSDAETGSHTYVGTPGSPPLIPGTTAPFELNHYYLKQKGEAYSFFAQMQFDITSQLELSGGARYSHEEKELTSIVSLVPGNPDPVPITPLVSKIDFSNTSPELTLTWRPSDTLTIYGSYKEGFLSGGFNGSSGAAAALSGTDLTYDEETVTGYEAGLKTILFDGALQANIALYAYDIEGLQVVVTTQGVIQELKNAGEVSSDGVEFDFNWETPLEGLSIHGAAAYADGQYDDYQGACYRGQTASSPVPCLLQESRVTHQVALLQDLSGTDLLRSPEWAGNIGAIFDRPISSGLKLVLSADLSYSDDYVTDATSKPRGLSPSYQILDASVRLAELNDRWGVSLIGKNLTGEYFWVRNSDAPFSGSAPSGTAGVGVLGDSLASINRGPEVLLRVDFRFGE